MPTLAKIQRIGHVVFATPNFDAALGFFRDVLNFRQSDAIGDNVAFFRCFRNPYHNGLGLFRGVDNSFNHINLMVTEIDDVGRAFNRMRRNDVTIVNGPGRHVASGSIFLYYLDPDGMTVECFFVFQQSPCTFYDVSFLPHTAHQLTVC